MHELDNACQAAVEAGDEERFHGCYEQLLELMRSEGAELQDDDLRGLGFDAPPAGHQLRGSAERVLGARADSRLRTLPSPL